MIYILTFFAMVDELWADLSVEAYKIFWMIGNT